MRVHEVMSTGIVTASRTDTVRSVVIKMMNRNCGAIPVVEGDGRLVGMVTDHLIVREIFGRRAEYPQTNAEVAEVDEFDPVQSYDLAIGRDLALAVRGDGATARNSSTSA